MIRSRRPKEKRNSYARRERFVDYMLWVKTLPCGLLSMPGHTCFGPIEADHGHPEHGKGEKCHDAYTHPVCTQGHSEITDFHTSKKTGPFVGWTRERLSEWRLSRIVHTQRTARARGIAVPEVPPPKVPWKRDRTVGRHIVESQVEAAGGTPLDCNESEGEQPMKKSKKPPINTCPSTASAGALKCVIDDEAHTVHSTSTAGRRAGQYATWSAVEDGRIRVITYSHGKKMSEWFEGQAVAAEPMPHRQLTLEDEPEDEEADAAAIAAASLEPAEVDDEPDELEMRTLARQHREAREAHARAVEAPAREPDIYSADKCQKCGLELGEHDGKKCPKAPKPAIATKSTTEVPRPITTPVSVGYHVRGESLKILGHRRHPAAALFELLEGEELAALADSIEKNGQRDPIVLVNVDGEVFILDGSNRGLACEMRGITARTVEYEGPKDMASLVNYSMDKNRHRRHQEPSVLAMVAVDAAQLGRGNPGDRETGRSAGLMTQAEAGARLGISERLVRRAKVVRDKGTAKVNEAVRKGKLAVEAAEQVTRLPKAKQDEIADEALAKKKGAVRSGRVRALVKQEEKRAIVRKINEQRVEPMPGGEFGVIYADYPWKYENSDQHDGSRGHMGYPPMAMDEILAHAREAATRAAKNCVIALWVTNAYVTKLAPVIEAFGAEQRTMWTWPKPHIGVGTWGRGQTEHLVIASIGSPTHTLNEVSTLLRSYQPHHVGEHSSKPIEVADLLRKHCSGPFLELFAKERREGWASWGAEVDKFATEAA